MQHARAADYKLAEGVWSDYDFTTHILTPADKVYVIHTGENAYFKLRFDSYYDAAGTPAMLQTSVAAIDAP